MGMKPVVVLTLALPLLVAWTAAGADEGFRSPSGNIHCSHFDDGTLRCDILETSAEPPAPPADCDLDWGKAFEMTAGGRRAARICHGDTVIDPAMPALRYGDSWSLGGFSCLSSEQGISCRNARGAGWDLSRAKQQLY